MKLETALDENPPSLFLAAVVDVIFILLIFFLLGSSLVVRSGMAVRLPASSSGIQKFADSHVITIASGGDQKIFLEEYEVRLDELDSRLISLEPRKSAVVIRADQLATHGLVVEVTDIVLRRGFDLAYATSTATETATENETATAESEGGGDRE